MTAEDLSSISRLIVAFVSVVVLLGGCATKKVGELVVREDSAFDADGHTWKEAYRPVRTRDRPLFGPHGLLVESDMLSTREYLINEAGDTIWIVESIWFPQKNGALRKYDYAGNYWQHSHYSIKPHERTLLLQLEIAASVRGLTDCVIHPLGGYYQFLGRYDEARRGFVVDRYSANGDARAFYNSLSEEEQFREILRSARPVCP